MVNVECVLERHSCHIMVIRVIRDERVQHYLYLYLYLLTSDGTRGADASERVSSNPGSV